MELIQPLLAHAALKRDILDAPRDASTCCLWWLGQSGFLVAYNGQHLLLDPYLSDSLSHKYAATDKPHTRLSALAIEPGALDMVHAVTSSHNHTDHLDADTLGPLFEANPALQFVLPQANRAFASQRLGRDAGTWIGLDDGQSVQIGAFTLHGIAAAHNELDTDEAGRHKYLGLVVEVGPWTIYHSGDCLLYDGLLENLLPFDIDVALVPINGDKPERGVAGNFSPGEAAWLAREIQAGLAIPCHYAMFGFNTADPQDFARECEEVGQPHRILQLGERLLLQKRRAGDV